mmetsp:Transcript_27243/g.63471  ORF Transcript_27243/g.63471 Transcript_27243/m.63471 type:complete len:238 (+) Transcript_27243:201-914(+)
MARIAVAHDPFLNSLSAAAIPTLRHFTSQELANTAWAMSTLPFAHRPLCAAISASAIRSLGRFDTQGLANMAWSFSLLASQDQTLMEAIAAAAIRTLPEAASLSLGNMAWAMAEIGMGDGRCSSWSLLVDGIVAEALPKLAEFNSMSLHSLLSATWASADGGLHVVLASLSPSAPLDAATAGLILMDSEWRGFGGAGGCWWTPWTGSLNQCNPIDQGLVRLQSQCADPSIVELMLQP